MNPLIRLHFGSRRIVKILIHGFLVAACMGIGGKIWAQVTISYVATNLTDMTPGQDLWSYTYQVSGLSLTGSQGFDIYFDQTLYTDLQSPPPAVNSDWNVISIQPDLALDSDGFYDAQAQVNNPSLADPFTLSFVWLGTGDPGSQLFEIYDTDFSVLDQGYTVAAVPEPSTAALELSAAVILFATRRRWQWALRGNRHQVGMTRLGG